jgi:hypothetical protein
MITQDELDHFVVKGFGIVVKMLEAREARTKAGFSEKVLKIFWEYWLRLVSIRNAHDGRAVSRDMHAAASIEQLDTAFVDAFENLVVYFERRRDCKEPLYHVEKFMKTLERFKACLSAF